MNTSMSEIIKDVEEEMKYETDDEGDSDTDLNMSNFEDKQINEKCWQKKGQVQRQVTCFNCDFVCNTEMSMKKHTNTKHPIQKS